ncbi:MAG: hypothetical protein O3A01_06665 [bacterium]|nr:hypothetical protein [bacterium]
MNNDTYIHSVHIPVMGTAFTIDSPIRVARFGISAVMSIGDDELCEEMRAHYSNVYGFKYEPIPKKGNIDGREQRIRAYVNLVCDIIETQFTALKQESFEDDSSEINKYFEILSQNNPLRTQYLAMKAMTDGPEKTAAQSALRDAMKPGYVDVNIMTKLDRLNYDDNNNLLPEKYSDALAALRAFATSKARGNIIFSAGFNRRLYAHCEEFDDFFPDENGDIKKGIVLKVSDFRSSQIQGRFLAKKGIWISEHRIESGLNCGGHAFATDGLLAGPIMQEFKDGKGELLSQLHAIANTTLEKAGRPTFKTIPTTRVTYQGGIGNFDEDQFLTQHYDIDGTGWASPFLLVPEVTILDDKTRNLLKDSPPARFYLSEISPLGIPFNTVEGTDSELQKLARAKKGRPGSPCPKGYLVSDTEFTKKPICKASVLYQKRKLEQLEGNKDQLSDSDYDAQYKFIVGKACLCEDLAASALIRAGLDNKRPLETAVCPGPNLGYFSKIVSLKEMMSHIYGRINLIEGVKRSNLFVNELRQYIDYIEKEIRKVLPTPTDKDKNHLSEFKNNLLLGISHYKAMVPKLTNFTEKYRQDMLSDLESAQTRLEGLVSKYSIVFNLNKGETLARA